MLKGILERHFHLEFCSEYKFYGGAKTLGVTVPIQSHGDTTITIKLPNETHYVASMTDASKRAGGEAYPPRSIRSGRACGWKIVGAKKAAICSKSWTR